MKIILLLEIVTVLYTKTNEYTKNKHVTFHYKRRINFFI
jgi:hypothetical protein